MMASIFNTLIVAGKDSCNGDSGGPLVALNASTKKMTFAGIVSFGTSKCGSSIPGVYTNVFKYMDWIRQHTTKLPSSFL